jgi:hypothetical protein
MVSPDVDIPEKVDGVVVNAGKAFTGSFGLVEGHDLMNGVAREKTSSRV